MAMDNGILILGDGRFEAHITRRSRNKRPYYEAFVSVRGTGRRYPSGEFSTYDAAHTALLEFVDLLLDIERRKQEAQTC